MVVGARATQRYTEAPLGIITISNVIFIKSLRGYHVIKFLFNIYLLLLPSEQVNGLIEVLLH